MSRIFQLINRWEWLLYLFLLLLVVFPSGLHSLALLLIPLLWLVRKISTGHFFPPTPLDVSVFVLGLALFLSLYAVFDINLSFPKIAGLIMGISLFYAGVQFVQQYRHGKWYLLGFIICAGTGMGVFALIYSRWLPPFAFFNILKTFLPSSLPVNVGTVGNVVNVNELAGVLVWILPLLLAAIAGLWRPIWHTGRLSLRFLLLFLVGTLVFNTILMLGTQSRGGYISLLAAIIVMVTIRFRWGKWLLLLSIIFAAVSIYAIGPGEIMARGSSTVQELGLQGRLEIWSRALYGISDFPITGMSMNGFRVLIHVLYPLFTIATDFDIGHAHNHLLQAALDLGILGLAAYLAIWVLSAFLLWRSWKDVGEGLDCAIIIGLSGSFMAGWIFGIVDAISLGAKPGFLWWLLLALLVSIFLKTKKSQAGMIYTQSVDNKPGD